MLHQKPAVLDRLEPGNEDAAEEPVEKYLLAHSQYYWRLARLGN